MQQEKSSSRQLFTADALTMVKVMRTLQAFLVVALAGLGGCSQKLPETQAFVAIADVRAMAALPQGGLRYADGTTGEVWDVTAAGNRSSVPVAKAEFDNSQPTGILSMAVQPGHGATFLSYTSDDQRLTVAQVAPGPIRMVWSGPRITGERVGGQLAFTPTGRLLVAVGDLGDAAAASKADVFNGKLVTLDPSAESEQRPNVISTGWPNPGGVTYGAGGSLWVASQMTDQTSQLVRANTDGPTGDSADLGEEVPTGLTTFGDQELVACQGDGQLRRFFLQNAAATPGRIVAGDCTGEVIELQDRRLAYVAGNSIRTTVK